MPKSFAQLQIACGLTMLGLGECVMKAQGKFFWVRIVGMCFGSLVMFGLSIPMGVASESKAFAMSLAQAANERTIHKVRYDGSYRSIAYPMGDVPSDMGYALTL